MTTKISQTPWKKQRIPRKLKKRLPKKNLYLMKLLCKIANHGRKYQYIIHKFYIN